VSEAVEQCTSSIGHLGSYTLHTTLRPSKTCMPPGLVGDSFSSSCTFKMHDAHPGKSAPLLPVKKKTEGEMAWMHASASAVLTGAAEMQGAPDLLLFERTHMYQCPIPIKRLCAATLCCFSRTEFPNTLHLRSSSSKTTVCSKRGV